VNTEILTELGRGAEASLRERIPGSEVTPEQLARRDWWTGPRLFVVIDDYELLATSMGMAAPLEPIARMLPHGAAIGLHVVIARSTSGAMRAMMDPLLRRMWELGSPAVLFSYPKEEGKFIGEARPRTLLPGRAQLVTRRNVRLIQTIDSSLDEAAQRGPGALVKGGQP
jgi:S-DNA-T family DNA segregation ATPase FtsK/SpoIIIE